VSTVLTASTERDILSVGQFVTQTQLLCSCVVYCQGQLSDNVLIWLTKLCYIESGQYRCGKPFYVGKLSCGVSSLKDTSGKLMVDKKMN